MRSMIAAAALSLMLFASAPARAAPTCQTEAGETVRCGEPGAMPVGWTLPEDRRAALHPDEPIDGETIVCLVCLLGGLFALIALMPDFDGWRDGDWDRAKAKAKRPRRRRSF